MVEDIEEVTEEDMVMVDGAAKREAMMTKWMPLVPTLIMEMVDIQDMDMGVMEDMVDGVDIADMESRILPSKSNPEEK